jgi:hypothetical protein
VTVAVAVATWAGGDDIARAPDAGNAGASSGLDCAPAAVVNRPTEAAEKMVVRYELGRHEQHIPRHHAAVDQLHAAQAATFDDQPYARAAARADFRVEVVVEAARSLDHTDRPSRQRGSFNRGEGVGWGEVDESVGPLAHDLRVPDRTRTASDDAEPTVADLVAMAARTMQDVACPPVAQSWDVHQFVTQAGSHQHPTRQNSPPANNAQSDTHPSNHHHPTRQDTPPAGEAAPEAVVAVGHQFGRGAGEDATDVPPEFVPS